MTLDTFLTVYKIDTRRGGVECDVEEKYERVREKTGWKWKSF